MTPEDLIALGADLSLIIEHASLPPVICDEKLMELLRPMGWPDARLMTSAEFASMFIPESW